MPTCRRLLPLSLAALVVAGLAHAIGAIAAACAQCGNRADVDRLSERDSMPPGAIARLGTPQQPISTLGRPYVVFLPDGATLFATAPEGKLRYFDVRSAKEIRSTKVSIVHGYLSVRMSPDGKTLAYRRSSTRGWTQESAVELWNLTTDKKLGPIDSARGMHGAHTLSFSADGRLLAVGGGSEKSSPDDPQLCVLDVATGKQVQTFPLQRVLNAVALSPDGKLLATAQANNPPPIVRVWDVSTGQQRYGLVTEHGYESFSALRISADGMLLAGAGPQPRAWDLSTGEKRWHIYRLDDVTPDIAFDLAFSPNAQMIAFGTTKGKIILVEAATGRQRTRFGAAVPKEVCSVAFSPSGLMLASVGSDCAPLVWDITGVIRGTGTPVQRLAPVELNKCWGALRHEDAANAWKAILALAARSEQAVPFLKDRIASRNAVLAPKRRAALLADLDSDLFAVREQACSELANLGPVVLADLKRVLANPASLEAKRRAKDILERIGRSGLVSEDMLGRRVLETLEYIGNPAAQELLQAQAHAEPASALAFAAKQALQRLAKRPQRDDR